MCCSESKNRNATGETSLNLNLSKLSKLNTKKNKRNSLGRGLFLGSGEAALFLGHSVDRPPLEGENRELFQSQGSKIGSSSDLR